MCFWRVLQPWLVYTLRRHYVSNFISIRNLELALSFGPFTDIPYFRTFTMPWTKYVFTILNRSLETLTHGL